MQHFVVFKLNYGSVANAYCSSLQYPGHISMLMMVIMQKMVASRFLKIIP